LEQDYLRPTNNTYPLYNVGGVEKSVNADRLFWKINVSLEQSVTETQLNLQVENSYTFYDYDKTIHTVDDATFMTRLLSKNEDLRAVTKSLFDDNSGFYFI
jgi:hypothetical protein